MGGGFSLIKLVRHEIASIMGKMTFSTVWRWRAERP